MPLHDGASRRRARPAPRLEQSPEIVGCGVRGRTENYYRKLIIETVSFLWDMFVSHGRKQLLCVATANQVGAS
jgi:hypothetical protein